MVNISDLKKCVDKIRGKFGKNIIVKFDQSFLFEGPNVKEGYWVWIYPESKIAIYGSGNTCDEAFADLTKNYEDIYGDDFT